MQLVQMSEISISNGVPHRRHFGSVIQEIFFQQPEQMPGDSTNSLQQLHFMGKSMFLMKSIAFSICFFAPNGTRINAD
jgi:hypothetical protein